MKKYIKYIAIQVTIIFLSSFTFGNHLYARFIESGLLQDTTRNDSTLSLPYPFKDYSAIPYQNRHHSPLFLNNPSNIQSKVVYDPETGKYKFVNQIGAFEYRRPYIMTLDEYRKWEREQSVREYWKSRRSGESLSGLSSVLPNMNLGSETFDKIFGSDLINIVPQGSADLIFGINTSRIDNPALAEKLRKTSTFVFKEKIQMNVTGNIGDKIKLSIDHNTDATFDFENRAKIEYAGKEDDIIKKIEAGNVNLPLSGSLITGSQSLFGLKTELQFGKLTMTSVFSQQKGETSVINVEGGAQRQFFEVKADEYEANRHFFLSQDFRNNYDRALENLPLIKSDINITRMEVWVTNKTNNFENSRNIVAFVDLAEGSGNIFSTGNFSQNPSEAGRFPRNELNNLYDRMSSGEFNVRDINEVNKDLENLDPGNFFIGQDYEKVENARKLSPSEYAFHPKLGYISLNISLNADEVLAVAYEYTRGGKTYQVGEFSYGGISAPDALIVKLLKGTNLSPKLPTWELMMKNVYNIGAYQVENKDFILDILYKDDKTGTAVNYLSEGDIAEKILLQVMNLDNLNSVLEPAPDGVFDFIEGVTVYTKNGRIIFPVLQPFGKHLEKAIGNNSIAEKYVFQELYDSTLTKAKQIAEKNKFLISGTYQSSSSSEISLNAMNIPQGSVVVTAAGRKLAENIDYTVDYTLGRVRIINQGLLESGTPIQISLESNSLFNIQTKTLVGTHLDYRISDNFNVGATILNLTERPLTQKVNIGNEPISNTIWGLNTSYQSESEFLTRMVDKIPFIETKEKSSIMFEGEFAHLIPGHSKMINKNGNAYIDDFEGSEINIDMKSFPAWVLASTPQGQADLFPEASFNNNLAYGNNRAWLAWYNIDPLFLREENNTPGHIKANPDIVSNHFVREVFEKEIFPAKETPNNIPTNIAVLNLAFYPEERGPYNYETAPTSFSDGLTYDGKLNNPLTRWGGVMREVQTNDFEAANIQFIEFWLMDPFVYDPDHSGGDIYFNLGNISEDILKDSRKSFENGLPTPNEDRPVDSTSWGRIPLQQALVKAFDNDPASRLAQDVGLDGLNSDAENSFFSVTNPYWNGASSFIDKIDSLAYDAQVLDQTIAENIKTDPSNDDFKYYRGSLYDAEEADVLTRYKRYNGLEGNSKTAEQSEESYPTTGTTTPDVEDINRDNTLSEGEAYYQYRVRLEPGMMEVGNNYISDMIEAEATFVNGTKSKVKWYQFRIPLSEYERIVGPIQDFKSIRFMRMFLKGFQQPVVLRMAKLDLVRSEWRKYNSSLWEGGEVLSSPEPADASFDISSVNIEENGEKWPVNYVLPPGIDRVIDPSNPQLLQLNEQSMVLKVNNLSDGDARSAFKTVDMDMRQYEKLEMEVHAEQIPGTLLYDDELTIFIRLGSDYKGNYYEYEIPLKLTPYRGETLYRNDREEDRKLVWPEENRFNLDLSIFQDIKQNRNDELRREGSALKLTDVYSIADGDNLVYISGNPTLSDVRTIMIGIRNPKRSRNPQADDGFEKSGEIWVNELRLSHFKEKGGWAANARMTVNLADFGTVTMAGATSTPGFGSIEKKVNERSKEEMKRYDISSNLELGKFFPEKSGIRIPMYIGYSETMINPQYNPLEPDIELKEALKNAGSKAEKEEIENKSQDYTKRKSVNFTNVRIDKPSEKPKIYSISNLSVSYSYNETFNRNINTEYNVTKNYRGGFNYIYNNQPKLIYPFKKIKFLSNRSLRLISDFNFSLLPTHLSFRTDVYRFYNTRKLRNINNPDQRIDPTYQKDFEWNRYYDVKFDLAKSLKFDFSASNRARIDETQGIVDKNYKDQYEEWKNTVLNSIRNFGRNLQYNQAITLEYTLPINKIPLLNWVNVRSIYNANYTWDAGPITADTLRLGNTIRNAGNIQINPQFNLISLYNKVGFLNKINQKGRGNRGKTPQQERMKTVTYKKENAFVRADKRRVINHKLKTSDITVKVLDESGKEIEGKVDIVNDNRVYFTADEDARNLTILVEGKVPKGTNPLVFVAENTARILMAVKNIGISYDIKGATTLSGYLPGSQYFGQKEVNGIQAPGWPFVLGFQDKNFAEKAVDRGWLTTDPYFNSPYLMDHTENLSVTGRLEPLPGLRIDLTANRRYSENLSEYYIVDEMGNFPIDDLEKARLISGSVSMTYISWGTAFEKITSSDNYYSPTFEKFKENRLIIANRLAGRDPDDNATFPEGYGPTSQEVLIPAFFAAYSKKNAKNVSLNPIPSIWQMLPNWRISFDGLSKIALFQKIFRSIDIDHTYRSTYSIGSFITNLAYLEAIGNTDANGNFIPEYDIGAISISEQFSPLLNVNLTWNNGLTTRFEYKKSRTLSLSFANNQLTELKTDEFIVGAGYRVAGLKFIVKTGGKQRTLESDLNLRADFSLRDDKTVLRKIVEQVDQIVNGKKVVSVKASADYMLSDRFNLRLFYDRILNAPRVSSSFTTANANFGINIRFTLTQ